MGTETCRCCVPCPEKRALTGPQRAELLGVSGAWYPAENFVGQDKGQWWGHWVCWVAGPPHPLLPCASGVCSRVAVREGCWVASQPPGLSEHKICK